MNEVKIVLVGDDAVGKTSLAITYSTGDFPSDYIPTVSDTIMENQVQGGENHAISVWDTVGSDDYDRLRPLSYPQTSLFLVCFSVTNRDSFESVSQKWIPEISHHTPDVKWMLVGTKSDLRSENGVVTSEEGPGPGEATKRIRLCGMLIPEPDERFSSLRKVCFDRREPNGRTKEEGILQPIHDRIQEIDFNHRVRGLKPRRSRKPGVRPEFHDGVSSPLT